MVPSARRLIQLSAQDVQELSPFCPCPIHQLSRFNVARYFMCRTCHGCIESGETYSDFFLEACRQRIKHTSRPARPARSSLSFIGW